MSAVQIIIAWHDEGYWLGDVKPSNFVVDVAPSPPVLYAIDFESVVCFTVSPHWQQVIVIDVSLPNKGI